MSRQRTVIKVGTSTLTYENGKMNFRRIERLCKVLCDLHNSGEDLLLVSSGAVGVGMGKTGLSRRPEETKKKQALAAIGQCELMFMYDKFFGEYNHNIAQILLTADLFHIVAGGSATAVAAVAIDEIYGKNFGDNDMLSAIVSGIVSADRLIILTDIDGLYDSNPKTNPGAKKIDVVEHIDAGILEMAAGTGSNRGTGGMITKLQAANYATKCGIEVDVINGSEPETLYQVFDGNCPGTKFIAAQ